MAMFVGYWGARIYLAAIFIASGSAKLVDNEGFASTLMSLGLATHRNKQALVIAFIFSLLELLVGISVLSGFWPVAMNAVLLGMTCCFSLVVAFALFKAPHTRCRCFGALSDSQFNKRGLVRNVVLTVIALFIFLLSLRFQSLQTHETLWLRILLIAGYALFAYGIAQAARIEYQMKEEAKA